MISEPIAARVDVGGVGALPDPVDPIVAGRQAGHAMPAYSVPRRSVAAPSRVAGGGDDLFVPPEPIADDIDTQTAEQAWREVAAALAGAQRQMKEVGDDKEAPLTLRMLSKVTGSLSEFASSVLSTEAALVAMQQLQNQFVSDRVKYALDGIREQRKSMALAMEQKTQKDEEAAHRQQQLNKKATKGQVVSVVFSWVASAAQVAVGLFKVCTGNPTGALDIAAGAVGMAKSLLETIALTHPDQREKLKKTIDDLAKAELVLSVVSGVIDIASTARMVSLGRRMVSGVCKGLMEGGEAAKNTLGVTLVNAMREGTDASKQCAQQLIRHFAETAAEQVGNKMQDLTKLSELVCDRARNLMSSRLLDGFEQFRKVFAKALSQDGVTEIIQRSLTTAAEKVAKGNIRETMVAMIKAEFVKEFERALRWSVASAVLRVAATIGAPLGIVRTTQSAFEVAKATNDWKGADEHSRILELLMQVSILEFLMQQIQMQIKDLKKGMERDTEEHVRNTEQISKHIREQIEVKLGIADSMQAVGIMA